MGKRVSRVVNILHNRYDIGAEWIRPALEKYIKPHMRAAVIALSFRDERVGCAADWDRLYAPGGRYYEGVAEAFAAYGIDREQIEFLNYFADTRESAQEKVRRADILYFLGGLPDRMHERIEKFGLTGAMREHDGIVMGYSAGALIQLGEYHLSPDKDYPEFGYYSGLGYLDDFYVEVHYEGAAAQDEAIERVLRERRKPVYGLPDDGAIIVCSGKIELIGPVKLFLPE